MVAAPILESWGSEWSWFRCGCHKDPIRTKFQFCWVPRMGGIKLQLLYGVRIDLAVGYIHYPGNYLDFKFVSPGWDRLLSGFPICKPCLDVRQNSSRDTHFPFYGRRPFQKPKPNTTDLGISLTKVQKIYHKIITICCWQDRESNLLTQKTCTCAGPFHFRLKIYVHWII